MSTPYTNLPNHHFHSKSVKGIHPSKFDPIINPKFIIDADAKIMTIGSCFAQHVSKWLIDHGYNILIKEQDEQLSGGVFSANYGNVYSVQQACQLYKRAMGKWQANENVYSDNTGRYFDPLRPSAIVNGFESKEQVISRRIQHEQEVKGLFLDADVIVFTLGLTETWIRKNDGAILPIAPGVIAGQFNNLDYEFKNFSYQEVEHSLVEFCTLIRKTNPKCKILLTVSPVPLAATYENKHVSVASMASKTILRAVIESVLKQFDFVDYFPSFEVFYTPGIGDAYFDYDNRHALPIGVSHAMRLFKKHYTAEVKTEMQQQRLALFSAHILKAYQNVNCDEGKIG
jgi:hypothetical protein